MGEADAPPLRVAKLLGLLESHSVRFVIVGGLAATVHGSGRVTYDIDVVPEWSTENLERLANALTAAGAKLHQRGESEAVQLPIDASFVHRFEVSTWRTRFGDLDVIIGTPTARRGQLARYEQLVQRAHPREAFGLTFLVADLDDVIESKEALARDVDLSALPELHRLRDRLGRETSPPDAVGPDDPSA
jgi:hypothetical protein